MLEGLNRALDHLEERLELPLDVAELARIATTSEYHFRRLFSALAGMPLSEYVRRRRLTLAGAEVLAGERTLLEVAVRYGYGSGEAFARAFRAVHGVGPGEARRRGGELTAQPRLSFRLVVEGNSSMRYRIAHKPEFTLVGRMARVPLVHRGENPHIAAFLRGLGRAELERIAGLAAPGAEPAGMLSVCDGLDPSRAEGTELDYYQAVVAPDPVPEGLDTLVVPAGEWGVFETSGPFPQALQELWRDVFTQWFPSGPYRSRPGPELLALGSFPDGSDTTAQLWIPVER
ncbi:AraC family transcriptional regulator [Kitasatospora albolonga]|uniref:AraC family transcriptional regulator n=1 Tax=Kitasatospora albolonga TaxID=68173 RepID=UPI0031E81F40